MRMLHQSTLSPRERRAIEVALEADPALAGELDAIAGELRPAARARFLRALAAEFEGRRRPAAAILAALERAVLG
jgi:hypothetical protein